MRNSLLVAALAAVLAAGCDSKPEIVRAAPTPPRVVQPAAAALPEDHPPMGAGMPEGHPPAGAMPRGHPQVEGTDTSALLKQVEAMKEQLKGRPKSFEICAALGNLYYDNARYPEAVEHYQEALDKAQDALALADTLPAARKGDKTPELEAIGCDRKAAKDLEAEVAKIKALVSARNPAGARACSAEALRPVITVLSRRANSFFLVGKPDQALAEHEKALAREPQSLESLFFVGAIEYDAHGDDVARLKHAQEVWRRFLAAAAKDHPRYEVVEKMLPELDKAIAAGGVSKLPRPAMAENPHQQPDPHAGMQGGQLPPVSPRMMEAVENTPRGPELDANLAKAVEDAEDALAKNDGVAAAALYRGVVPFQPGNSRAVAGMAASQILKGTGMADRVFAQAARDPKAIDELADRMKAKGNAALAKTLWTKLAQASPGYAEQLKKKLE